MGRFALSSSRPFDCFRRGAGAPQTPPCSRLRRRLRARAHPRTPRISCDYPRWWLRVQPRRACARDSSRFPLFPAGNSPHRSRTGTCSSCSALRCPRWRPTPAARSLSRRWPPRPRCSNRSTRATPPREKPRPSSRVTSLPSSGRRRRRQTFERTRRVSWRFSPGVGARWNRAMWWLPRYPSFDPGSTIRTPA